MRTLIALILVCVLASGVVFYLVSRQQVKRAHLLQEQLQSDTDTTTMLDTKKARKKRSKRRTADPVVTESNISFVKGDIDSLAVHKAQRVLQAFKNGALLKEYKVALGLSPIGPKVVEGDNKTPEGWYFINSKNPFSRYHKSLAVSYPNQDDKEKASALGKRPGGDIMIHGLMKNMNNKGKDHIKSDWTFGCVAVTDEEIDELFVAVNVGTPILILP